MPFGGGGGGADTTAGHCVSRSPVSCRRHSALALASAGPFSLACFPLCSFRAHTFNYLCLHWRARTTTTTTTQHERHQLRRRRRQQQRASQRMIAARNGNENERARRRCSRHLRASARMDLTDRCAETNQLARCETDKRNFLSPFILSLSSARSRKIAAPLKYPPIARRRGDSFSCSSSPPPLLLLCV